MGSVMTKKIARLRTTKIACATRFRPAKSGNLDFCITIRSFTVHAGQVYLQVGAGIVADSDPAREYQEVLHKARVLFQVLEGETA